MRGRIAASCARQYYANMGISDTIFICLAALLLFGPKKLPEIARQIGKVLNEFRRASNEFRTQIESEISQLDRTEQRQARERKEQDAAGQERLERERTGVARLLQEPHAPEGTVPALMASSTPATSGEIETGDQGSHD